MSKHNSRLEAAMREVHKNIPSTVQRADVHGEKREKMLRAIAFSKAGKSRRNRKHS
jgi:hypothetical protein